MCSCSLNDLDLGNSTGQASKWEKIKEILKLKTKQSKQRQQQQQKPSSLLQEVPRVFTNVVTWKKKLKGGNTLVHSNIQFTLTSRRRIMLNKMC